MTTLQQVELGVLGPLQVRQYGLPVSIPGAKPRAILTMLGLHGGSVVSADTLVELLWGDDPPRTAAKALQTHISALRRALGDGFVLTEGMGWALGTTEIDATRYEAAIRQGRDAIATGDASQAVARFDEALTLWRGTPELPDGRRGESEKTRWVEGHAALVEDRADALLATGRAAEIIGELEAAIADAPLRERRWGHLMLALYRAGRQGEALGAYQRARSLLADELGVDPGPDLRRLEAAIIAQDVSLELPVLHQHSAVTRAVTFLLTDIEGSTAAWEKDADAMAVALTRHDEIVEQVVTFRAGRLIKTRGEGDATFSVFDRPSAAAAAAIELQEAIRLEPWALAEPMRIRISLHTGEVEFRDGDYFGRAVNRAARLRSLAAGGQILCSGATAELVIDSLSDDVVLADLGMRHLKNLARPEHVFELRLENADDARPATPDAPMERPALPAVLAGPGPFVGRNNELERLLAAWQATLAAGTRAVLIAGEPGVGKTRLAGEWSRQAYEQDAVVLYGRCDEDMGAPYQPFAEALRSLVPCLGTSRLRGLRGVEALLSLVPGLTDVLPDLAAPPRADADTERYALFDAVVGLLGIASASAPIVLILDDLHWAARPTLLLLRHLLRFGEHARVQIVGTYRSTDLDRSHPLAAMLADMHRDGSADRLTLGGLDEDDVTAYVAEAGYDEELARALASVTGGNPFFLIEALRHVDESGGHWDPSTLPQGVREAVSRRLSRLPAETNKALAAAAVVGSRFGVELVERVVEQDLVDAFDEACKAGLLIEEPGGRYRFNHALVRQSLLTELASVRRMRLHQRIAGALEAEPGADDELLAELAYHYFECAWAGNAAKAVEYCRRAADQAMARLAYEGAADLYDKALHALDELDDELPDRDDVQAELLVARCEALLAAGDVVSATGAVAQLQSAAGDSARLAAWGTCFDGQLSMLTDPERLDEIESAVSAAAEALSRLDDAAGEAKAHTVRAACLARLGRVGDCETALDQALTAARQAREHRRVNAVLAGAPLAALWGPNPVPRAGGRCLDVVRLLRITTGSPVVEATSMRCQGVLDAFRGRAAAGRQLIDSARRTLTELGMRHALLEVEQFAGIVELVADDPAAAEKHLRRAYNGFRRMGLEADTAETAALLARACLALDKDAEADELCTESERLAGHAFKAAIAWRTVRAQLLARRGDHEGARRTAEEAVAIAERTDALVDHGDACLALAAVLGTAGDAAGARAAAERAVGLYELKGAAALAEKARDILGVRDVPAPPTPPEAPTAEAESACVRAIRRVEAAVDREDWDEVQRQFATEVSLDSRRKVIGFPRVVMSPSEWAREARHLFESGTKQDRHEILAVRGERLALTRSTLSTEDVSPGAPRAELLRLFGLNQDGRIALQVAFDVEDIDAAIAELDTQQARFEQEEPSAPTVEPENACVRAVRRVAAAVDRKAWDEVEPLFSPTTSVESRRKVVGFTRIDLPSRKWRQEIKRYLRDMELRDHAFVAVRGDRLALARLHMRAEDAGPGAPQDEVLELIGLDEQGRIAQQVWFDVEDIDAAIAELDAQHARLEATHPRPPLENAASRAEQRLNALYTESRWDEIAAMITEDAVTEERRRGFRRESNDRATLIEECRVIADLGVKNMTSEVIAIRGERIVLSRVTFSGRDRRSDAFHTELLRIAEMSEDERLLVRVVTFDVDDLDAAFAELDARYLAGEAAPHAHTWAAITNTYAAFNRNDPANVVNVDHRRAVRYAPGELTAAIYKDVAPNLRAYIEVVHRLTDFGAVVTGIAYGTSHEGFEAEWRQVQVLTVDGDLLAWNELFDEADLDAALARFDELGRPAPRLANAASQAVERYLAHYAACEWDALARIVASDISNDDRRRTVNAGTHHGRDAEIASLRASADAGFTYMTSVVVAVRGESLVLARVAGHNRGPEEFLNPTLSVVEINAANEIAAIVVFDPDDFDAAFAELDTRYLAGEAAVHARTWSIIAGNVAAFNRHEIPAWTSDLVSVDHRRVTAFAPGDHAAYLRATLEDSPDLKIYIETVHRLSDVGAVVSYLTRGTSRQGFEAEWRGITVSMIDGDRINHSEQYDEADLDAALARFDELKHPAPQLENAASRVSERFGAYFAARDWAAMRETIADDFCTDDRRRVVGAGVLHGPDSELANLRAIANVGITRVTSDVIATRGKHLILYHARWEGRRDQGPEVFPAEVLGDALVVFEINADERIVAIVDFDLDDIDAAHTELESRYLAGEAAPHAHTWSVITQAYAALNRHELAPTTSDFVHIDHHRLDLWKGDFAANMRAAWEVAPDWRIRIAAVHRLTDTGALVSCVARGTSQQGFDAEQPGIAILTIQGELINRFEYFDETDLHTALARFDELSRPAPRLENAATRVSDRLNAAFAVRDWHTIGELWADDVSGEDRRHVIGGGPRSGRDAEIANLHAMADLGATHMDSTVLAIRGRRLALHRTRVSDDNERAEASFLTVIEVSTDDEISKVIAFDTDDLDAAFTELDARYLAGEAAPYAQTWSVVSGPYAAINRHEVPPYLRNPDLVNIDHRRAGGFAPGEMSTYVSALWDQTPDYSIYIEVVHRLSSLGAVVTHVATGTSQRGFEVEWRDVALATTVGDLVNRCEVFDEADLDAALARFDELTHPEPHLVNAASGVIERYHQAYFAGRNWDAMAELVADDFVSDDRRQVVNSGVREGRDTHIADLRAAAEVGSDSFTSRVIATRGQRLVLAYVTSRNRGFDEIGAEIIGIGEIDSERRLAAIVTFAPEDIDAAFAELDARYLAGEAALHADTWLVFVRSYAAANRQEMPEVSPGWVSVDHRRAIAFAPNALAAYTRATWEEVPDFTLYIEAVHRLSHLGAVVTQVGKGASQQGFEAEWREIVLGMREGELFNRSELFDETDLDAALARFDELQTQPHRVENAATRVYDRYLSCFAARDWDAIAGMLAEDHRSDDRRRVANEGVRHGRDAEVASLKSVADAGATSFTSVGIATRGDRLALCRVRGSTSEGFSLEVLRIVEIDADERIVARVAFDLEDINAAFEELESRYLAGEAAAHAHTWSVILGGLTTLKRHELPELTPDCVDIDHRRGIAFAPGDLTAYVGANLDEFPDSSIQFETVHRLNSFGAVVTFTSSATSRGGFDAEWRMIQVVAVRGDKFSRFEVFDEEDLDAALEKFDKLSRPRLKNAASRVYERLQARFTAGDWDAMTDLLADDFLQDDRRRVVGAGTRHGRDAQIDDMRAIADLGFKHWEPHVIATRGARLFLRRVRYSDSERPDAVHIDVLEVVETDAEERMTALVIFDPDDIDAALDELDARYAAGEAAAHARTWSLVVQAYAGFNRRELPAMTSDWVSVDHRRGIAAAKLDVIGYAHSAWDTTPDVKTFIETVHRLSNFGAVVTAPTRGTSKEGFDAEWRDIHLLTFEGDLGKHFELFDEADLDAALARFDELNASAPALQNAATRVRAQLAHAFNRRDMAGFLDLTAADVRYEDRRKGLRDEATGTGLTKVAQALFEVVPTDWLLGVKPVALRGSRLGLTRDTFQTTDEDRTITTECLTLTGINDVGLMRTTILFDPDDIDAAFAELDARYLADEAAAYASTWSAITHAYAATNRHEIPAHEPDWITVDHRQVIAFAPGEMTEYIRATLDLMPDFNVHVEAVHRLNGRGVVVTQAVRGTSPDGFVAEWREIVLAMVEGDRLSRVEMFDEDDLDAALARFDELSSQAPQLENAATRARTRVVDAFNRRDLGGFLAAHDGDGRYEDRRKGLRNEGPVESKFAHGVLFDAPASWRLELEPVAVRGSRFAVTRDRFRDTDEADRPIAVEVLVLTEVTDAELICDVVVFDPDDINGVMAELTARWIASGEVAHPEVIEAARHTNDVYNRHDWDGVAAIEGGAT